MARIRSVKPELRDSLLVASWPFEARFFWVVFWGYLDDEGRGLDLPKRIAGDCFPHDNIEGSDIDAWLNLMSRGLNDEPGPVCRYSRDGKRYVHAVNWREHQKPNRPTPSRIPPCPVHESLTEPRSESFTDVLIANAGAPTRKRVSNSVAGAAEQQSRGAEEQQQRAHEQHTETNPGHRRIVQDATDATDDEADAIIRTIVTERRPRSLGAFLRTLATDGDLKRYVADLRNADGNRRRADTIAAARDETPCDHGMPGGASLHPDTHQPFCPLCRSGRAPALKIVGGAA